jgi:hypothetical protein
VGRSSTATRKRLRRLDERFAERRYRPAPSRRVIGATVVLSLSGVALDVGTYAKWFRADPLGPWEYAHYVLGVGLLLLVGYFALLRDMAKVLRVGELGVAVEIPGSGVDRTPWHEIHAIRLRGDELRVEIGKRVLAVPLAEHAAAARRILAEVGSRIASRSGLSGADRKRIGKPAEGEGESVQAEPPQVTGLRCSASGADLTFEQDVRLCGACAAPYAEHSVPKRCVECDAPLRS